MLERSCRGGGRKTGFMVPYVGPCVANLMFLVTPCDSLCTIVKQSGLTGCPVVLVDGG